MNPSPTALLLVFAFFPFVQPWAKAESAAPLNIIYILADDLGYGDVSCLNPGGKISTPHIDRLAREGMTFTDAHSASSVCTPTRYGILTGRYAWRTRLDRGVLWGLSAPLIAAERLTVAQLLKEQGYETAVFGKWHLGMDWPGGPSDAVEVNDIPIDYTKPVQNGPTARGFDLFHGISASLDMAPYVWIENDRFAAPATRIQNDWFRAGIAASDFEAIEVLPRLIDRVTDFIKDRSHAQRKNTRPFFLYFALPSPHTPIIPAPAWQGRSAIGKYGDFVMQTDGAIGEVLAALDAAGIAENTLVIFTSDNGASAGQVDVPRLAQLGHYPSAGMRGFKSDLWEGGHRMPFIVRWPAAVSAGTQSNRLLCLNDFMATCAELTGVSLPANAAEDSVSFLPALLGRPQDDRGAVVHHSMQGYFSIREGPWKLLFARGSGGWTAPNELAAAKQELPAVQLYNLSSDRAERANVADQEPEMVARLSARLAEIVSSGRSTPGPLQNNDRPVDVWEALDRLSDQIAASARQGGD